MRTCKPVEECEQFGTEWCGLAGVMLNLPDMPTEKLLSPGPVEAIPALGEVA